MCGNFNGNPDDDFMGKNNQIFETALEFAKSWQRGRETMCEVGITQAEVSCLHHYSPPPSSLLIKSFVHFPGNKIMQDFGNYYKKMLVE